MRADWAMILSPVRHIYSRYWRRSRWALIGIAAIVLLSAIGNVATPTIFSRLIDTLDASTLPGTLVLMFVGYAALRGLTTALTYAINYLSLQAAENLNFIVGTSFFERLLKKQVSFFIEHNPVEIQTARDKGEDAIYVIVQLGLLVFIPGIAQILLSVGVLGAIINLEIVLIVLGYGAVFIALTYFTNTWTRPLLDRAIEAGQENAKFVGNAVNAMETLRYFGGERWVGATFADKAGEARAAWTQWAGRRIMLALLFGAALASQLAITFVLLVPRYFEGDLSVGDIVLINMLLMQLNQPFERIGSAIDDVLRAYSGFLPFARMWAAPEEPDSAAGGRLQIADGQLAFEGVGFAYGDKPVVRDASFVAARGGITFIVGETGSGKTSLFKMALKALEPQAGRILVDGTDLAAISRHDWYRVVGVVSQDVLLLNDTIGANIALGRPLDQARLCDAAERASILDFVTALPDGFDTRVGERGLKLSGGERQRVAIARALYAQPEFLFLDEASSALDEATEGEIMAELRRLDGDTTILAITHRRGVIGQGDRVIEMAGGVAREAGGDKPATTGV